MYSYIWSEQPKKNCWVIHSQIQN